MNNISSASKLDFFKSVRYEHEDNHIVDNSANPRPHFCMGLLLCGSATFMDCEENKTIELIPGDIIFVPISSRYISKWHGDPKVSYISTHFIFDYSGIFSRQKNFLLQKITLPDFDNLRCTFEDILDNFNKDEKSQLLTLSKFYEILYKILPLLKTKPKQPTDQRINTAIEYIEANYTKNFSIEELATLSNMSISRFFPAFKKSIGLTPVEYLNHYRISRAIILLMNDNDLSIEIISEKTGFDSSAYFRRVFKKITGKTPREYRKTLIEI